MKKSPLPHKPRRTNRHRVSFPRRVIFALSIMIGFYLALSLVAVTVEPRLRLAEQVRVYLPIHVPDHRPPYLPLAKKAKIVCDRPLRFRQRDPNVRIVFDHVNQEAPQGLLPFPAAKPEETRIFIVGASAARGDRIEYPQTFAGLLGKELFSRRPVREINVGIWGGTSDLVAENVRTILDCYYPDVLVVYLGNDFFEWRYRYEAEWNYRLHARLAGRSVLYRDLIAIVRLLRQRFNPIRPLYEQVQVFDPLQNCGPKESFPEPRHYNDARWQEDRSNYLAFFEFNVEQMILEAKAHGVPMVLCNTPLRHRVCPAYFNDQPLAAGVPEAAARRRVRRLFRRGLADLRDDRYESCLTNMRAASESAPRSALPYFFAGEALRLLDQPAEAAAEYDQALENVVGNLGAVLSANEILARLAARHQVPLADLDGAFRAAASDPLDSDRFFNDFTHPNERGHRIIADTLLPLIQPLLEQ